MPAPAPADSLSSLGRSTTTASVVVNRDDTLKTTTTNKYVYRLFL